MNKDLDRLIKEYPSAKDMNEIKRLIEVISDLSLSSNKRNGEEAKLEFALMLIEEAVGFIRFKVQRHEKLATGTLFTKSDKEDFEARIEEIKEKVNLPMWEDLPLKQKNV